jgi:hypothetical protein
MGAGASQSKAASVAPPPEKDSLNMAIDQSDCQILGIYNILYFLDKLPQNILLARVVTNSIQGNKDGTLHLPIKIPLPNEAGRTETYVSVFVQTRPQTTKG